MGKWFNRIRGVVGIGLSWAVGWAPLGGVVGVVLHWLLPGAGAGAGLGSVILLNATTFAVLGFSGGSLFAGVLRVAETNRQFDQLSMSRFALWGGLGGLLLGVLAASAGLWGGGFGVLGAVMIGASTVLGAGSASGTLAIARGADARARLAGGDRKSVGAGGSGEIRRDGALREHHLGALPAQGSPASGRSCTSSTAF